MPAFNKARATRGQPIIVLFYMDMCPHCVMMKPAWHQAKSAINPREVSIAEVEYSNMNRLPKEMQDVRGFPSIKVFKNDKIIDEYLGERSPEKFLTFMRKYASAPAPVAPAAKPRTAPVASAKPRTAASKPRTGAPKTGSKK